MTKSCLSTFCYLSQRNQTQMRWHPSGFASAINIMRSETFFIFVAWCHNILLIAKRKKFRVISLTYNQKSWWRDGRLTEPSVRLDALWLHLHKLYDIVSTHRSLLIDRTRADNKIGLFLILRYMCLYWDAPDTQIIIWWISFHNFKNRCCWTLYRKTDKLESGD